MAINLDAKKIQTKSQWQKSENHGRWPLPLENGVRAAGNACTGETIT